MLIEEIKKRGKVHVVRLWDMKNFFRHISGYDKKKEIYRVIAIERNKLSYAITIIKSGKINNEYFMTKGHYHKIPSPEIYYLLKGKGVILIQRGNDFRKIEMKHGKFYEIPEGYAHRTINIGDTALEFLSIYLTKSGHDYKTIEKKGFKQRIISR
jgi:glucose-6-phosphate isomerase